MKKTIFLKVRATPEERDAYMAALAKEDRELSAYLRACLDRLVRRVAKREDVS
jgi:hypothetical protein